MSLYSEGRARGEPQETIGDGEEDSGHSDALSALLLLPTSILGVCPSSAPFTDDIFDHSYEPSTSACDRLVNSTHDYYGRVDQLMLEEDPAEHSYAFLLPGASDFTLLPPVLTNDVDSSIEDRVADEDEFFMANEYTHGLAPSDIACSWEGCSWSGEPEGASEHVDSHVRRGDRRCRWQGCQREFAKRYLLTRHLHSAHLGLRPFSCDQCPQTFATKERLTLHSRASHSRQSKYICTDCRRTFKTTSERRHHFVRVHLGERRECPECGKFLSGDEAALSRHRRRRHGLQGSG